MTLDFHGAEPPNEAQREALHAIRDHVVELRMSGRPVPSTWLATLAECSQLTVLDQSRCEFAEPGLADWRPPQALQRWLLSGSSIRSEAVEALLAAPSLEEAYLSETELDGDDWQRLQANPSVRWVADWRPTATVLEQESEVVFEDYRAPGSPETTADLQAINSVCPVAARPIDPSYRLVFEERVIGFCCADCLAQFATDPDDFAGNLPD